MKILFCLILPFLIYLAQADWFEDQIKPYPCTLPRIRRSWGDLTSDQKKLYARVVFQLFLYKDSWLINEPTKRFSLYYTLARMHGNLENGMLHSTSAFPLHHKAYLWTYESAIIYTALVNGPTMNPPISTQEACSLALPYWEWDKDFTKTGTTGNWDKIYQSDVFQEPAVFGDTTPATNGQIDTGYFSPITTNYGNDKTSMDGYAYPITRIYSFSELKTSFDLPSYFNQNPTFASFLPKIHSELHTLIHNFVSGLMGGTGRAGFDPLFYLHHCNNDRLWHIWVDCHGWEWFESGDLTDIQYQPFNPMPNSNSIQYTPDPKVPFKVTKDDQVFFYVDKKLTAKFLPETVWPKIKDLWFTGKTTKRGWNGLFYRYGPDKLVRSGTLICPDKVWSLVNQ